MIVCQNKKFVFVKTNKIAGTTIVDTLAKKVSFDDSLRNLSKGDHESYQLISHKINLDDFFVFTFVRNPWDRLVSMYKYLKDIEIPNAKKQNQNYISELDEIRFEEYIIREDIWKPETFYSMLKNEDDKIDLDFIGKFENLNYDFNKLLKKLNIEDIKLSHKNRSKHKHYTEYYTPKTKQIVEDLYKDDITYFNYKYR